MPNITAFYNNGTSLHIFLEEDTIRTLAFRVYVPFLNSTMPRTDGAVVFYDYIITLPQEIHTLWRRKKSVATCAVLVNRYALLLYVASQIPLSFPVTSGNPLTDPRSFMSILVSAAMILTLSCVVFDSLRIYGIMQHNIRVGISVAALGIGCFLLTVLFPVRDVVWVIFHNGAFLGCQGGISIMVLNLHRIITYVNQYWSFRVQGLTTKD
ncbi:hypothetical protein QCA50_014618 [Cerrena zonata]|uniref:DUF6533 domain-containing protein n=1 Tax=Cerrena zonata TaxID=2478898 RepID=A0AAW0FXT1_9APHY